ncbi:hypothetical protein B0T22DRAFT_441004 [Podospora appendiculata]|uniref:Methyltransferase type 11 domain-containing protein n=1 Tax=Podospora appendiculata TaxID=314037 RepID=A0AAE0XBC7_9PEZI|nr:hypothetical protein B0T22DRAFT_441004 [Podospora appendiculata]
MSPPPLRSPFCGAEAPIPTFSDVVGNVGADGSALVEPAEEYEGPLVLVEREDSYFRGIGRLEGHAATPSTMAADIDKQSYWHKRFSTEVSFEWLVPSAAFMPILNPYLAQLPSSGPILHLGIGTSDLHTHIRKRGFENLANIDYEQLAIDRGRQLEQDAFGDLDLGSTAQYDLVVDKSTADAIACSGDEAVAAMVQGIAKCLAEGGLWVSLSYSALRYEIPGLPFDVEVVSRIPLSKARETDPEIYYYCYLLRAKMSDAQAC